MKRQLATLCLFAMTFGMCQLPTNAMDFNLTFGRHDRNNDGYWNRREFYNANKYYYQNHPEAVIINRRDLNRDFDRYDTDNDGLVRMEEVRTYHDW